MKIRAKCSWEVRKLIKQQVVVLTNIFRSQLLCPDSSVKERKEYGKGHVIPPHQDLNHHYLFNTLLSITVSVTT